MRDKLSIVVLLCIEHNVLNKQTYFILEKNGLLGSIIVFRSIKEFQIIKK